MQKLRKAVFPVAGLGTRFLPATKSIPKEILTLVDRPLIQYAIDEARAAGIEQFIFVTARGKSSLEDYFDDAPHLEAELTRTDKTDLLRILTSTYMKSGALTYVRQNKAHGLGHAVWCARNVVGDEPFAVILPDDVVAAEKPCLQQMVEAYAETGGSIIATMKTPREKISSYGVLDVAPDSSGPLFAVRGMVEKPKPEEAPSDYAIIGRYILAPQVMESLSRAAPGAGGEIQLTDSIAQEIGRRPVHGFAFEGRRFDCGSKSGFIQATIAFALEREDLRDSVLEAFQERFGPIPAEAK